MVPGDQHMFFWGNLHFPINRQRKGRLHHSFSLKISYYKKALFPWVLGLFDVLAIRVFSSFIVKNSLIYSRFRSFSICSGFSEGMCNWYSKSSDCIACKQLYFYLFYQSYTALCTALLLLKWTIPRREEDRKVISMLCVNKNNLILIAI